MGDLRGSRELQPSDGCLGDVASLSLGLENISTSPRTGFTNCFLVFGPLPHVLLVLSTSAARAILLYTQSPCPQKLPHL